MGEQKRTYLVHVPKGYDPKKPAPVVLALHGAAMNGPMMVWFSGLNKKSDEAGFIVVYPSGTGTALPPGMRAASREDGRRQGRRRGLHRQAAGRPGHRGQGGREAGLRLRHEQRGHDVLPARRRTVRPDRRHRSRGRDHRHRGEQTETARAGHPLPRHEGHLRSVRDGEGQGHVHEAEGSRTRSRPG